MNEAYDSKFITRKWNIVNDNSKANFGERNEITHNTEVLKSNLCDYIEAYILVRCNITVRTFPQIQVAFQNCAPFTKCITKMDQTTTDDANLENLKI